MKKLKVKDIWSILFFVLERKENKNVYIYLFIIIERIRGRIS